MKYVSTRNAHNAVSSAQAIVQGLAADGGLFVPESCPRFSPEEIRAFAEMPYSDCAAAVLARFLDDYTPDELTQYARKAYSPLRFGSDEVAPVVSPDEGCHILELFHGPTCAFKDFALQLLPYLLTAAMTKTGTDHTVAILVATSGDTGKAALEGFADVPKTKICVFYPDGGTSNIQRLQMTTQTGSNVLVLAAKGNFDDAQNGVKRIFTDRDFAAALAQQNISLSSANSINWGRLVPQIAYYFRAYARLLAQKQLQPGQEINIAVPTGNFGNILAAFFARECGLPVRRLICASNRNNVLTDFFSTGTYDRNRSFHLTASPSMDILISSNLERLLWLMSGQDGEAVSALMHSLSERGSYTVDGALKAKLSERFWAGCCDDVQTAETIRETFEKHGYLCDTHTAVAVRVYRDYCRQTGDRTPTVIASTASPFKFAGSVLSALGRQTDGDDFALLERLSAVSGLPVPAGLAALRTAPERFGRVIAPADMKSAVADWLTGQQS